MLLTGLCPRHLSAFSALLLTALFSGIILRANSHQHGSFPASLSEVKSPDGRYTIRNSDSLTEDPAHRLTLVDINTGSVIEICQYPRHVDVLWSPDSSAFVVNDHEGSDSTRPLLYSLPWTGTKTDLLEELTKFLRGHRQEGLVLKNGHVYLTVRRWISSQELLCHLESYGDASRHGTGFKGHYVYKIGAGFRVYKAGR